jgi:hypothetical protein
MMCAHPPRWFPWRLPSPVDPTMGSPSSRGAVFVPPKDEQLYLTWHKKKKFNSRPSNIVTSARSALEWLSCHLFHPETVINNYRVYQPCHHLHGPWDIFRSRGQGWVQGPAWRCSKSGPGLAGGIGVRGRVGEEIVKR